MTNEEKQLEQLTEIISQARRQMRGVYASAGDIDRAIAERLVEKGAVLVPEETVETRAVKIAARIMQAAGLCRLEDPMECRKVPADEGVCDKCIEDWLLDKAREELEKK